MYIVWWRIDGLECACDRRKMTSARYFDCDFDWDDHARNIDTFLLSLPPISPKYATAEEIMAEVVNSSTKYEIQDENWNSFYDHHEEGMIYKPRRYLLPEFAKYWENSELDVMLEVGCGYGCSCFPILRALEGTKYIATDCSEKALEIFCNKLSTSEKQHESRVFTCLWDITEPPPLEQLQQHGNIKLLLSVFALSAVHPSQHKLCLEYFSQVLHATAEQDAFILFRDYGLFDMTMFRHRIRLEDRLFVRQDSTFCYYFSLDYLRSLAEEVGLNVVELKYATVINRNRKTGEEMRRVFVHGVFSKSISR